MSILASLTFRRPLLVALVALSACSLAHAQSATAPMPFYRKTAGWLVSDTAAKKIFLCRDLNGNGSFADPGEVTVFFDGTNASGVAANCTDSVFTMYQASDGTVYYGNGASNTVYAIRDNNLSGTAQDAGEGRIFFDQTNFSGVFLPTPNGLTGDATFLYVCNAGTSPAPQDGIYRLRDVNADGNANASGESSIFLDMNTVIASNISSPFDICNLNGALIYADNRDTATPDRLYRVQDADASGTISASELTVFHTVAAFGAPSGAFVQTCVTDGTSIYTHDRTASVNPQRVARLTDANSSGSIDATTEVTIIWSETNLPSPEIMSTSQGIAVAPGALALVSNGTGAAEVILARDLNSNTLFSDAGETTVSKNISVPIGAGSIIFPQTPRQIIAYAWPCQADFNTVGGINITDIFDFLAAWFAGDPRADFNGVGGITVTDIFDFLAAWFAGC